LLNYDFKITNLIITNQAEWFLYVSKKITKGIS